MLIDRIGAAPAWQVVGVLGLGELYGARQGLGEIGGDGLGLDARPQEIRPQELAERGQVLGVAAGVAQFPRQAAVGVVLELREAGRNGVEPGSIAVLVIGVAPVAIVE